MKLLLAPYIVVILLSLPMILIILSKLVFLTKSSLLYLGDPFRVITELLIQFSEFSFFGCIHFWLYYIFKEKFHISTVILNVYFITFYFLLFCIGLYDYQNGSINMQGVLISTIKAYLPILNTQPHFSTPIDMIPRNNQNSLTFLTDISFAIEDEPVFWCLFIAFFLFFFSFCIYLIIKFKLEICISVKDSNTNNDITCSYSSLIEQKIRILVDENIDFNSIYFKIMHILGLLYLVLIAYYSITPISQRITTFTSFTSIFNIIISLSHYEKKLNPGVDLLNITRKYLPKGRYWLDNRKDPVYPLVHGDINAFCAYNNKDEKCQNRAQKIETKTNSKLPNIYFLVIESFNPFSYLINDDFIDEHSNLTSSDKKLYVTDTPYYNEKNMPNLAKYAKEGIVFSGMASHGLPTLSGMHSLITGIPPSQTFMNIIEASEVDLDDFPSYFHETENYQTLYANSADYKYEGFHLWLDRRSAKEEAKIRLKCDDASEFFDDTIIKELLKKKKQNLKKCSDEEIQKLIKSKKIKSFPKWFDYLFGFFPDENQSRLMNLTEAVIKKSDWLSDRILSKKIQLFWKQQKEFLKRKKLNKPIMALTINMETHIPYYGFDNPDQYEPIYPKISRLSDDYKKQRFIRANKYTDKNYIKSMFEFLKKEDNNTIVVVIGDHGTRDIPIRKKNTRITEKTYLSNDCIAKPSGTDSLFITSGGIFYLGDDERVKKEMKLDFLKGKTIKVATDHNDLVYTILETLSRLQNKPLPPTHRIGRNLFDFSEDIIKNLNFNDNTSNSMGTSKVIQKLNDMDYQSLSYLSYQIEYKRGSEFIRTHSYSSAGAHYYNIASFPTCLKKKNGEDMKLGGPNATRLFKDMVNFLNANNYLLYHNRVFNYEFRDEECIKNGVCNFPHKEINHIKLDNSKFFTVLFTLPFAISLFCSIIILIIRKKVKIGHIHDPNNIDTEFESEKILKL